MIKNLGILAFVFLYYCEINAEIGRRGLTTRFPEDVENPLLKFTIKIDEPLSNDLRPLVVEARRTKNNDVKKNQTEKNQPKKKYGESNQPKIKKKPSYNLVKLHSNNTKQFKDHDSKDQKDKKVNKEKARSGKINKHITHKEKENEHTEKNTQLNKHTNITKAIKKGPIIKTKKNEDIHKHKDSEKRKPAVGKSKTSAKVTKSAAVLRGNWQSQSSHKLTMRTTFTPKPRSKPRVGVVYKTMSNHKVSLDSLKDGKKIRGSYRQGEHSDEHSGEHTDGSGEHGEGGGAHGGGGGAHGGGDGAHGGGDGAHGGGGGAHGGGGGEHGDGGSNKGKGVGHGEYDHGDGKQNKKDYPSYLSPYAIMTQMEELMKEFPNANATVTRFARTVEYNDIVLVSVSEKTTNERYSRAKDSKYIDDAPEKKIIFLVHGLTVMGMKSLTSLVQMSELKLLFSYYFKHLDKFDFYIMPLANPDGYSASRSPERAVWNKNMSPQSVCPGVFADRNFDIAWNTTKDISSCSQLFPGDAPFSEVESKAVRDVFHYYSHKILAYIHVHAGTYNERVFKGDAILYPRGYTETQSDDDKYIDLKGEIDEAMKNASFRVITVTVDTLANWYGIVAGSSVDYAAAVFGIPYALEFVMQIFDSDALNNSALTQIWSRLIDTTIINMWKSLHHASEERKSH